MSENGTERAEEFCRVCCEPMDGEDGNAHNECHKAAKEEFEWYQ